MADKMMRISGRGLDGKAKPFATDDEGLAIVKSPVLKTFHHVRTQQSGIGEIADVSDYNSIGFQLVGTFKATVSFEATSYGESWLPIKVEDEEGNLRSEVSEAGFYRADINGFDRVRAVVGWESGSITVVSNASLENVNIGGTSRLISQNNTIDQTKSNYQIGKSIVFYGGNGTARTDLRLITPANFANYSKKSVYVINNSDADIKLVHYTKYSLNNDAKILERVPIDILVESNGGVGKLSYVQYPDLNEPFDGLSIDVQSWYGIPESGDIEIYWMGGN